MTLLRYIHQNPLKPHLVDHLSDYAWSSWPEYLGQCKTPFCSTDTVLRRISLNDLTDLINNPMTDNEESGLLDVDTQQRKVSMSDQEVWKFIESQCGAKNVEEFQQLARPEQKVVIFNAHEEGVGPRTLSRLTGVPYTIVQRATSNKDASFISRQHGSVCDSNPDDEEYLTYFDAEDLKEFPEF